MGKASYPCFRQAGKPCRAKLIYFHFPNYAWHMGNRLAEAPYAEGTSGK